MTHNGLSVWRCNQSRTMHSSGLLRVQRVLLFRAFPADLDISKVKHRKIDSSLSDPVSDAGEAERAEKRHPHGHDDPIDS